MDGQRLDVQRESRGGRRVLRAAVACVALALPSCTFLQPRQVVIHTVASEPSAMAQHLPECGRPSAWEATTGVVNAGLEAFLLTQCRLCQLGYVLGRMGLVGGGVAAEWMQRAQTNKVAAHRVAVPLRRGEGAPLVYTFQSPDGTTQSLVIPQRYLEGEAPPPLGLALWRQALVAAAQARLRNLAPQPAPAEPGQ